MFFCYSCKNKFAKILRKIKSTLQHRKNKSRFKNQTSVQFSSLNTPTEATASTCLCKTEPKVDILQTEGVTHHNLEEELIKHWNTARVVLDETSEMETNLNKVLNQSIRHQLNGLLCKYTNVMKGSRLENEYICKL